MIQPFSALTAITAGCRAWLLGAVIVAGGLLLPPGLRADLPSNQDCLDCHTDPTTSRTVNGKSAPLALFPTNAFQKSVHAKLACTDCHVTVKEMVHPNGLPPAQCASCHQEQAREYSESIHGMSKAMGASGAATCVDCHGSHDMQPVKSADSPVFKLNLPLTCAKCHNNPGINAEYRMKYPDVASQYADSIHGRALLQMGLILAPSCNNCHGVHNIKRSVDRGHLRLLPFGNRENIQRERAWTGAGQGRTQRPRLHRLPFGASNRGARRQPFQSAERRTLRTLPSRPP
jgi:hypothetical protein